MDVRIREGGLFGDTPACSGIRARGKAVLYKHARTAVLGSLHERTRDEGLDRKEAGPKKPQEGRGSEKIKVSFLLLGLQLVGNLTRKVELASSLHRFPCDRGSQA